METFPVPGDEHLAARHLELIGPPYTSSKSLGFDPSGIDCLVIVIRRLYALSYMIVNQDDETRRDEEVNPVLAYAWRTFARDDASKTDDAKQAAVEDKRGIVRHLCGRGGETSFRALATSAAMNATMWSGVRARYFLPDCSPERDGTLLQDAALGREVLGDKFLVRFDCTDPAVAQAGLEATVNCPFGHRSEPGGRVVVTLCGQPRFLRVLYTPSKVSTLGFLDLREFDMEWNDVLQYPSGRLKHVPTMKPFILAAVVRMRSSAGEPDLVRTYSLDGAHNVVEYGPARVTNNSWSLQETDASYMLFYSWNPRGYVNPAWGEVNPARDEYLPAPPEFDFDPRLANRYMRSAVRPHIEPLDQTPSRATSRATSPATSRKTSPARSQGRETDIDLNMAGPSCYGSSSGRSERHSQSVGSTRQAQHPGSQSRGRSHSAEQHSGDQRQSQQPQGPPTFKRTQRGTRAGRKRKRRTGADRAIDMSGFSDVNRLRLGDRR